MLATSPLISDASGKLGNTVWAKNQFGLYVRSIGNANPNPPTPEQLAMRQAMTDCVARWKSGLTSDQRSAWAQFALDNPEPSRLGVVRSVDGLALFTRANIVRRQAYQLLGFSTGTDFTDDPPEVNGQPFPTILSASMISARGCRIEIDPDSFWRTSTDNNFLALYFSPPLIPTVQFYKSPMTLVACTTSGDDPTFIVALPEPVDSGNHVKLRMTAVYADGSVAPHLTLDVPAAP